MVVTMNRFYKVISLVIFLSDVLIICGIASALFFSATELMMILAILLGSIVPIIWCVSFMIFIFGLILYRRKIIAAKIFVLSIFLIIINCYLTYLCQFTHTPDIFTCKDFIWATRRFFFLSRGS